MKLTPPLPPSLPPSLPPFVPPSLSPPALSKTPKLASFFASKIPSTSNFFQEIDENGDGEVNWTEFLNFLERIENTTEAVVTDNEIDKVRTEGWSEGLLERNDTGMSTQLFKETLVCARFARALQLVATLLAI